MSPALVVLIAGFTCSAAIAGLVWLAERLDPPDRGRHAPFADPADRTDPHGEQYIATLKAHEQRAPDLAALTRGLGHTGWLEPLPEDDDPADTTGALPVATCYLGMPSEQYVDELFGKYAEAQQ